ncbi:MAG: BTAD domain-containing putative transcriptional regulator, partial [Chloroflexota bacterium]
MPRLTLTFFGPLTVTLDDQLLTAFRSDKVRALLAYLALEPNRPHTRKMLAGLLWPEVTEKKARDSIRVTLHRLRQTLNASSNHDDAPPVSNEVLTTTYWDIQFNLTNVYLDVAEFQAHIAATQSHHHAQLHRCDACLSRLEQAASLYRGELLAGFGLRDAAPFEEWLLLRREAFHQQAIAVCTTLSEAFETQQSFEQAQTYATQLLTLNPYQESAHRQMMRLMAQRGMPDQAISQYEKCRQILHNDLGIEPDAETQALLDQIRQGKIEGGLSPVPAIAIPLPDTQRDLREMPHNDTFFGRQTELGQLQTWLLEENCQLVAVLGLGGVGKTALIARCVQNVADQFDVIIWRSLLNTPLFTDVLVDLLQTLSSQETTDLPDRPDAQLSLLLDYLIQKRCLLILDNLESTLQRDQVGYFRAAYEGYGRLIQQLGQSRHQSCLLLTSREQPQQITRLLTDHKNIQALSLAGLADDAGQALFLSQGLSISFEASQALVHRYSGNPLALNLISRTIQDFYFGDVDTFLKKDTPIFDDIRMLLDQQFNQLSKLEQELLLWFAIMREPVQIDALERVLVEPVRHRVLLEALQTLQRRCLLERHQTGFGLQNVVTEYLTDWLIG